MTDLLADGDATTYLGFNRYDGEVWFAKERMDELRWWLLATALVSMDKVAPEDRAARERLVADVVALSSLLERLERAEQASGYRVSALLEAIGMGGDGE